MSEDSTEVEYRTLDSIGYPNYRVGSDGSVWSKCHVRRSPSGWYLLKPYRHHRTKHQIVRLHSPKHNRQMMVHQIVALAFLGPVPLGMIVCHNDGIRDNNRADNLRYDTPKANALDRELHKWGYEVRSASAEDLTTNWSLLAAKIRAAYKQGATRYALSREFGVTPPDVDRAIKAFD